jgi:hypothetical protein
MIAIWFVQSGPVSTGGQLANSQFARSVTSEANRVSSHPLPADSYGNLMAQAAAGEMSAPAPFADAPPSGSILTTDLSSLNSLLD